MPKTDPKQHSNILPSTVLRTGQNVGMLGNKFVGETRGVEWRGTKLR